MSPRQRFGPSGVDALARGALRVIVREATAQVAAPRRRGDQAGNRLAPSTVPAAGIVGAALFAGGVAVGLAGALLLPRTQRGQWARHADRALRVVGDIGLALAEEALHNDAIVDVTARPASPPSRPARTGLAGLTDAALRVIRRR